MPVSPMELAIRYPAVPRTRIPPMMNFVRARIAATSWRLAPVSRSRRLVQCSAANARHDRAQLLFGLRTFFRSPEIEVLVGIAHAKQQLVDQLAKRGVSATFRIWGGGGFAHAMSGRRSYTGREQVIGAAQLMAIPLRAI